MTIADILKLDSQITVLQGETGVNRHVTYIDVVEIPEGMYWTSADDFIITTGYCFASNEALFELLVRTLIRRGVAGLGIKIGKYIDSIPDPVAKIANEHAFPIIQIPMHFSYREISKPFFRALAAGDSLEYHFTSASNFFEALIRGDLSGESEIRAIASQCGVSVSGLYHIVVARSSSQVTSETLREINCVLDGSANIQSYCLKANGQNTVLIIFLIRKPDSFAADQTFLRQRVFDAIRRVVGVCKIAVSAPCNDLFDIRQAALYASALLSLGLRLHPEQQEFLFSDYYLDLFLNDNQNHHVLNYLYHTFIVPLAEEDTHHNADLLSTLQALCDNSFCITKTAQSLFLHRNTVYHRIKHIESTLKCCINDLKTEYALTVACKYYRIQQINGSR